MYANKNASIASLYSNFEDQSLLLDSTGTQSTQGIGDAQASCSTWDSSVSKQSFGSEVSRSLHTVPERLLRENGNVSAQQ